MTDWQQKPQTEHIDSVLDREVALAFVGHDPIFLDELLVAFQDYRVGIIERIKNAVRDEDTTELHEAAHQLNGALGNFHARGAVTTVQRLMDAGQDRSLQNASSLCKRLDQELDLLCDTVGTLLQELQQTD